MWVTVFLKSINTLGHLHRFVCFLVEGMNHSSCLVLTSHPRSADVLHTFLSCSVFPSGFCLPVFPALCLGVPWCYRQSWHLSARLWFMLTSSDPELLHPSLRCPQAQRREQAWIYKRSWSDDPSSLSARLPSSMTSTAFQRKSCFLCGLSLVKKRRNKRGCDCSHEALFVCPLVKMIALPFRQLFDPSKRTIGRFWSHLSRDKVLTFVCYFKWFTNLKIICFIFLSWKPCHGGSNYGRIFQNITIENNLKKKITN